jgi:hypothetical protein
MFSQESKLAVLESKLNIYEELSREMLSKLEAAVEKISEGNNRIAMILTKHDERIEQSIKTDELIIRMIEDVKESNSKEHLTVVKRLETVEKDISELSKFKWQSLAIVGVIAFATSLLVPFIDNIVQVQYNGSTQIQNTTK